MVISNDQIIFALGQREDLQSINNECFYKNQKYMGYDTINILLSNSWT